MEKTWICSYCEKEFPAAEIYMDCEQGHKYCSSCQKLLKLMETDNGDFSLLKRVPVMSPQLLAKAWTMLRRGYDK